MTSLDTVSQAFGREFASLTELPLLLSVRSGAAVSMPGMMDTLLNVGLNDQGSLPPQKYCITIAHCQNKMCNWFWGLHFLPWLRFNSCRTLHTSNTKPVIEFCKQLRGALQSVHLNIPI